MRLMQGANDESAPPEGETSNSSADSSTTKTDEPMIAPPTEVRVGGEVRVNGGRSGVQVTQAGPLNVKRVGVDDPQPPTEDEPQQS